ncbi:hypothetical protein M413DRAFT_208353 [Hebeloma cylindrosporum]|uniref:Guanine nucleotide-binding protein-like 1 n=1 Tax=Hebeloma cylindrosporum TaxID=76867 RepID=A0A0C2YD58_HEBCY|nr:hypothetical protein M413DRAFT_208353 [Hebeloma cylindrosporum h7]
MPPRRKPTSTRQKKADQQLKRAIKRGDAPPQEVKKTGHHHRKPRQGPTVTGTNINVVESARKLQSAFIKLPPRFLEETKAIASNSPLARPIPDQDAIFHDFDRNDDASLDPLSCPKRPKWRFDMSKLEVERNEEGLFKKWIEQTDEALEKWQNKVNLSEPADTMPRSPSYFERNLEVWRQLWRVTEISQIILVLLDSRCPTLHYPPSLSSYLGDRKVILVLTKVDISGPTRVDAWIKYIHQHHPNVLVVQVESYIEKEASLDHQGSKQYEPSIPDHFRATLLQVIKEVHAELLEPPERVKSNPDRLKSWVPAVKREIDWEGVMRAKGSKVGLAVGGATVPRQKSPEESPEEPDHRQEPEYLTIGLIGQPNVGKSSLLNALFGARKVRASKTPGKTKHFQTLYWTPDVRLVDCPGLVMPNYVPMEMQVLCGILPISRVSAVPSCIYFAAKLLPLERILKLVHPSTKLAPVEDKRTWRDGRKTEAEEPSGDSTSPAWTAMDILTAYADAKGWVTAKAGRPDVHRAGNAILRALAEGRIGWCFWPPGTPLDRIVTEGGDVQGIWIPRGDIVEDDDTEPESDVEAPAEDPTGASEEEEEYIEDSDVGTTGTVGVGRFGALAINDTEEDGDEDDADDSN